MSVSKKPYRGCRDFFPQKKRLQNFIFDRMRSIAELFSYEPYDGPMLEEVELYKAKSGEELINDQIYSFTDRGDRFVAIRPEMTPTLARMIAQIHKEVSKPIRWYSIPNLFRYEKPQRGRVREHWQFNCDIFGAPLNVGEIEIIQLVINFLNSFGADNSHFEIQLNDRRFVDEIFKQLLNLDNDDSYKLYKIIDKSSKISKEVLNDLLRGLNLSQENMIHFSTYMNLQSFDELLSFIKKNNISNTDDFINFIQLVKSLKLTEYIKFSPNIVRGLDYYTGIVFEVFDKHPDNRRAIAGGGSYQNLLKIFNEQPIAGVGFGLGDVTLSDFLDTHKLINDDEVKQEIDVLITFQCEKALPYALNFSQTLRSFNFKTFLSPKSIKMKKAFSQAEKINAQYIVLIGDNEIDSKTVTLKHLNTKTEKNISIECNEDLLTFLK